MKTKTAQIKNIQKKESSFFKSAKLLKNNPAKFGLMILFDIMFLLSAVALNILANYSSQFFIVSSPLASAAIFIIFSMVYYLLLLLSYSFFKFNILDFTKSLFEKAELSFKRFGQFFLLNIIISVIIFALLLIFNYILASVKPAYSIIVFVALAVPFLLCLYIIINISHSLFYETNSIKNSLKNAFKTTFTKIRVYRETILVMIAVAMILWLLFSGSGYLIRLISSKNYTFYLTAYSYFKQASVIIFDVVFYLVILINRISFYSIIRESK